MKTILIALMAMALSACVGVPARETMVIEKKTIEVISVKEELLQPCELLEPPAVVDYMKLSKDGREDMLTRYVIISMANLKHCSIDKATIKKIQVDQKAKVDAFNQAEALRVKQLSEGK